jgi:hypothetical protein
VQPIRRRIVPNGSQDRQSAFKFNPSSASNFDPFEQLSGQTRAVALRIRSTIDDLMSQFARVVGGSSQDAVDAKETRPEELFEDICGDNPQYSKPQAPDAPCNLPIAATGCFIRPRPRSAVWTTATVYLLTRKRDMGGGKQVMIKIAFAPIWIDGRHWGFRINWLRFAMNVAAKLTSFPEASDFRQTSRSEYL